MELRESVPAKLHNRKSILFALNFQNQVLGKAILFEVPWFRKSDFKQLVCACVSLSIVRTIKKIARSISSIFKIYNASHENASCSFSQRSKKTICVQGHLKEIKYIMVNEDWWNRFNIKIRVTQVCYRQRYHPKRWFRNMLFKLYYRGIQICHSNCISYDDVPWNFFPRSVNLQGTE